METPRDSLDSIGYLTNLAARLFLRALERRSPGGVTGPMPVFLALHEGNALPQKELARIAAVEQPTMANTLGRMQRDGLISRMADPHDGRSTLIRLTSRGLANAEAAMVAAGKVNQLALSALEPVERLAFVDMLRRVIGVLGEDGP
jgi:DNA-binding MarR family transcriptional regulator